jgi:hypothetical protein
LNPGHRRVAVVAASYKDAADPAHGLSPWCRVPAA